MYITAIKTRENFDINKDFRKINFHYYRKKAQRVVVIFEQYFRK